MMSLPILSSRFFQEHRPDVGFFSKWNAFYAWSEKILPVYEWQGVLFVGCLHPPEHFPKMGSKKVVFVLCEPGPLQSLWLDFQAPQERQAETALEDFKLPELNDSAIADSEEALPALSLQEEAPEGLNLNFESTFKGPTPSAEEPEGFNLFDSSEEDNERTQILESSEEESAELLDLTAGGAPPITALATDPQPSTTAPEEPKIQRATPAHSEVLNMGEVTKRSHEIMSSSPPSQPDPWTEKLFQKMESTFQKSMVLLKLGDSVKPWKWDAHFQPSGSASSGAISLVQPSPFRIVSRTRKPYHGYLVMNDFNKKFLADWNQSEVPEHLTLTPILVDEQLIGMLLAIGNKSADSNESLKLAESMAQDIAQQIKDHPQSTKVA